MDPSFWPASGLHSKFHACAGRTARRFVVECKRWARTGTASVGTVRQLYGVKARVGADHALLETPANYSADSWKFVRLGQRRDLHLVDYEALCEWFPDLVPHVEEGIWLTSHVGLAEHEEHADRTWRAKGGSSQLDSGAGGPSRPEDDSRLHASQSEGTRRSNSAARRTTGYKWRRGGGGGSRSVEP